MKRLAKTIVITATFSMSNLGHAANVEFQDYLFLACQSATAILAERCAETDGGGDVSADSESSLNPSQSLSVNDVALDAARNYSSKQQGDGDNRAELLRVEFGPFGGFTNLRVGRQVSDREVDVDEERGYTTDIFGFDIGADYQMGGGDVLGVMLSYETQSLNFDHESEGENFSPPGNAGGIDAEVYSLMAFSHFELVNGYFFNGNLGYSGQTLEIERKAVFQEVNRALPQTEVRTRAETDGRALWLSIGVGYRWEPGSWQITPTTSLSYSRSRIDGYTELDRSSSGMNMEVSSSDRDSALGRAAIAISKAINSGGVVLNPQFRLAYEHEFARSPETVATKFVQDNGNNNLLLRNEEIDASLFSSALSLDLIAPNTWVGFVDAELLWGNDFYSGWRFVCGISKQI